MKRKLILFLFINITLFLLITYFAYFANIQDRTLYLSETITNLKMNKQKIVFVHFFITLFQLLTFIIVSPDNLNDITDKKVGSGQHGSAKWADIKEIKNTFALDKGILNDTHGWYVGTLDGQAMFEKADRNILVISPPGAGKTKSLIYNNIIHSMACNEFILVTDTKTTTYHDMKDYALALDYKAIHFDFRSPFNSHLYNFLSAVNKYMDLALFSASDEDKILNRAKAQRYAKILSNSIIKAMSGEGGGQNQYFYDVAEGIITSVVLLISEFTDEKDRHVVNVLRIVAEGMKTRGSEDEAKTELYYLLEKVSNDNKAKWFAEAAVNADIRTSMNTFSTALSRLLNFIDDELEQAICKSSDFDIDMLFQDSNNKYLVVINIPEENPSRHFLASLLFNTINNQLIEKASEFPKGELPFIARILLDEFGTIPKIPNVEDDFTAGRSRRIYYMPVLQNIDQLPNKYGDKAAKVVRKACQNFMFSGLSSNQYDEAENIAKAIGKETILTGSISKSNSNAKVFNAGQISTQMTGRYLIMPEEILKLKMGEWIMLRMGSNPIRTNLKMFSSYRLPKVDKLVEPTYNKPIKIEYLTFIELYNRVSSRLTEHVPVEQLNFSEVNTPNVEKPPKNENMSLYEEIKIILTQFEEIDALQFLENNDYYKVIDTLYPYTKNLKLSAELFKKYRDYLTT